MSKCIMIKIGNNVENDNNMIYVYSNMSTLGI